MFHQIIICICIFATVYSSPIIDHEISKIISLLTKYKSGDAKDLLINEGTRPIIDVTVYELMKKEFSEYKAKYNKVYKNYHEEEQRLIAFLANMATIKRHNELHSQSRSSYRMEINHMSDWTAEEYNKLRGFKRSNNNGSSYIPLNLQSAQLPSEIDWREKGAVTPVKNQAHCGSCYSFSATGSLEGQIWRKTGKLISLSEQQIVDCDTTDDGCHGGDMTNVFSYIKSVGGVMSEEEYPYVSGTTQVPNDECSFVKSKVKATDSGFVMLQPNEAHIQEVVATIGPVSIGIYAPPELAHYQSGIFYDKNCEFGQLNHGVLIVGYGTDKETGMPYWIIKNSWGAKFGEDGYFRMPRNVNACNITAHVVYPLV